MQDKDYGAEAKLGTQMTLAFQYIQQIFRETAQLMATLDDLMGADWTPTYGNRTTRDVTSHLAHPDDWLVRAVFRIYDSREHPGVRKGISIAYWGNGLEQPILIGGRLDYTVPEGADELDVLGYWDLSNAWFEEDPEDKRIDGSIYQVDPSEPPRKDHIRGAHVFGIPLASVESEDDIRTKVYHRLMEL
jgi:hypothetical protein